MSLHKEIHFEDEICEHLSAHGWLYADAAGRSSTDVDVLVAPQDFERA